MAIHKRVPDMNYPGQHRHLVLPAFSFAPTDGLAQLVVDAWSDAKLRAKLLERDRKTQLPTQGAVKEATARVKRAGYDLTRADRKSVV